MLENQINSKEKSTCLSYKAGFFFQTFFYAAIDDSEYSFAYILTDTDKVNGIIEFVGNWIEFIQLFCLSHLLSWFTSWLNSKKINLFLQEFRRSQEPVDRSSYTTSYYNLLKEYLNPVVKEEFPHAWEELEILENETQRYPGLTISYEHSTIFLAPKSHCDPIQYLYDDNLAKKTINAHRYMNSYETDDGCIGDQIYDKGIR